MTKFRFAFILRILAVLAIAVPSTAQRYRRNYAVSQGPVSYYGEEFYKQVRAGVRNEDLRQVLYSLLTSGHRQRPGQFDEIVNRCFTGAGHCYFHRPLSYNQARTALFGQLYLERQQNTYFVKDVYCEKQYTQGVGPNRIPDDKILNAEHTWPQSRFSSMFPKDVQKSDLHHLFPSQSTMNAMRGNFEFAEVGNSRPLPCPGARLGQIQNRWFFEPPAQHKGNVARALFYFAVRYKMEIKSTEEAYLRKWHQEDPPNDAEIARNNGIYELQGDRNPFIDHPELVGYIGNF